MSAHSNRNTHCDTYSYSHAYANHYPDVDRNNNPDCNDYADSYTQANAYTKSFSNAAAAADAGAKTVIPK